MRDSRGNDLRVDDLVVVPYRVIAVCEQDCTVVLETLATYPYQATGIAASGHHCIRSNANDSYQFGLAREGNVVILI